MIHYIDFHTRATASNRALSQAREGRAGGRAPPRFREPPDCARAFLQRSLSSSSSLRVQLGLAPSATCSVARRPTCGVAIIGGVRRARGHAVLSAKTAVRLRSPHATDRDRTQLRVMNGANESIIMSWGELARRRLELEEGRQRALPVDVVGAPAGRGEDGEVARVRVLRKQRERTDRCWEGWGRVKGRGRRAARRPGRREERRRTGRRAADGCCGGCLTHRVAGGPVGDAHVDQRVAIAVNMHCRHPDKVTAARTDAHRSAPGLRPPGKHSARAEAAAK